MTMGGYDLIVILDMPDDDAMAGALSPQNRCGVGVIRDHGAHRHLRWRNRLGQLAGDRFHFLVQPATGSGGGT